MRLLSACTARRAAGAAVILAGLIGISGCAIPPGANPADFYGELAGFCGFLQSCGSDNDTNRGGSQTASGSSSDSSSSSSSSPSGDGTTSEGASGGE